MKKKPVKKTKANFVTHKFLPLQLTTDSQLFGNKTVISKKRKNGKFREEKIDDFDRYSHYSRYKKNGKKNTKIKRNC